MGSEDSSSKPPFWRFSRHKKSHSADLSSSLFSYISVGMWLTFIGVTAVVYSGAEQLINAFNTNISLNGLIITILLVGVGRSVWSNVTCWRTARYLKAIDTLSNRSEKPTVEDVDRLRYALKKQGKVLDTKQMYDLLANLPQYGHLNVTDNDARVIKSKIGFRVSNMRGNTGFLAGLLVMLGLLGTFWGLLSTIDAVGKAMGGMSNIGDNPEAMGGFLASIAAPLDGMGLAFSSSLFGLAGSLLTGFVNWLSGGVHNRFIESCSRWIDDRIPTPTANMRKGEKNPKVASSDELKAWMVGFVQQSLETNRQIAQLVETVHEATRTSLDSARNSRNMLASQRLMEDELKDLRRAHAKGIAVVRKEINDRSFELAARLKRAVKDDLDQFASQLDIETADTAPVKVTRKDIADEKNEATQAQLSELVDNLQNLLEQQDVFKALRANETAEHEGLPPTLKNPAPPSERPTGD